MNSLNKLTLLRVILIRFCILLLLGRDMLPLLEAYVAAIIFIVASLTDLFDGKIARKP